MSDQANLCPMPWTHLVQRTDGGFAPCCKIDSALRFRGQPAQSLDEAWQSEDLKSLRESFLRNERPECCRQCWAEEDAGKTSDRQARIEFIAYQRGDDFFPSLIRGRGLPSPISLDIKTGNICNLKCRICSPAFSSKLATEWMSVGLENEVGSFGAHSKAKWQIGSSNLNQLKEWLPNITHLEIYGGEPLLSPDHLRILEACVESGYARQIFLRYNTNGTQTPDKFLTLWSQFERVELHFSIDDVGARFNYQRKNADWEFVNANLRDYLARKLPNMQIGIFTTYSVLNIFYLEEVLRWATDLGLTTFVVPLQDPKYYRATLLPRSLKRRITTRLESAVAKPYLIHQHSPLQSVIAFLNAEQLDLDYLGEFFERTAMFDHARNEAFREIFPEFMAALTDSLGELPLEE